MPVESPAFYVRRQQPRFLRLALGACLCLSLPALGAPAHADQTRNPWTGPYFGLQAGADNNRPSASGVVAPYVYPGFSYPIAPPILPLPAGVGQSTHSSVGLLGGYLVQRSGVVFGLEVQIDPTVTTTTSTGVASYSRNSLGGTPVAGQGALIPCGFGFLSSLCQSQFVAGVNFSDAIGVQSKLDANGAVRLRAGVPVGDRLLVSLFGGPALAVGHMQVTQTSMALDATISGAPGFPTHEFDTLVTGQVSSSRTQTLLGSNVGAEAELRLGPGWALHGEYGLTSFPAMKAQLSTGNSQPTSVSVSPRLFAWKVGIVRHF